MRSGRENFDWLAAIAKVIKPDVVLFSALNGKPTSFVQKYIERVREELEPLEIDVKWYELHYWVTALTRGAASQKLQAHRIK